MLQLTLPAWYEIQTRKMRTQSKSMKPPSRIFGRRKKNQILLFGTNTQNMFNTTLKQKKNALKACTNYLSTSLDRLGACEGTSIVLELGEQLDP